MTDERLVQAVLDAANQMARIADALEKIERMWRVSPPGGGSPMIPHPGGERG